MVATEIYHDDGRARNPERAQSAAPECRATLLSNGASRRPRCLDYDDGMSGNGRAYRAARALHNAGHFLAGGLDRSAAPAGEDAVAAYVGATLTKCGHCLQVAGSSPGAGLGPQRWLHPT